MKILALDLATKTGWAVNSPVESSGVDIFDVRRGESPGTRFLRFVSWFDDKVSIVKPDLVVFEKAHHRGGAATEVAVGFATHLMSRCAHWGIEHLSVHTGTLKKFATGSGKGNKQVMMDAYREKWGKEPIDDNECDARWLLEYGLSEFQSLSKSQK